MSDREPPRVATWLAQYLVPGPKRESLLGDLIEQYLQGRSGIWYWRQVLVAILVGNLHEILVHKMLAVRTLAIGWTLYYLFSFPVIWAARITESWVSQHLIVCNAATFSCQFWRNQLSAEPLIYLAAAVSGAIVARLHKKRPVAMLLLYAGSVLLFECALSLSWMVSQSVPPVPVSRATLVIASLTVALRAVSLFVGGMWAVRCEFDSERRERIQ